MMKHVILSFSMYVAASLCCHAGQFVGKLEFKPKGCETTRDCRLVYDFGYIDSTGIGWQSSANDRTDGATIPSWAQGVIGQPFEPDFIKAAVIHDHYCDRNVRTWRQTHRVFYDALLASGVSDAKAKIMYYAVLIGGPKWANLIPGDPCKVGHACIKNVPGLPQVPDTAIVDKAGVGKIIYRAERYDQPAFQAEFNDGKAKIEAVGKDITMEQIDLMARAIRPDDFFLNNDDAVKFEDAGSSVPKR